MKTYSIFGVETQKEIQIPEVAHSNLVDNDLIHFDGQWRYFESNEPLIKTHIDTIEGDSLNDKLKTVRIGQDELTERIIKDIKEMDADVFEGLIEYIYNVRATYDPDNETVILTSHDNGLNISDIF